MSPCGAVRLAPWFIATKTSILEFQIGICHSADAGFRKVRFAARASGLKHTAFLPKRVINILADQPAKTGDFIIVNQVIIGVFGGPSVGHDERDCQKNNVSP